LRERDRAAFAEATSRYEQVLVPELVDGQGDPVVAWLTYGAWLSAWESPGETVVVDRTGRSRPFGGVVGPGELYLHLPADSKMPATKLLAPLELSEPQRETISLLVR
jgi:hypothetical protein